LPYPPNWTSPDQTLKFLFENLDKFDPLLNRQFYTVTKLPLTAQAAYSQAFKSILHYLLLLIEKQQLYMIFFRLLHHLPVLVLSAPHFLTEQQAARRIRDNCSKFLNGKIHVLYRKAASLANKVQPPKDRTATEEEDIQLRRAEAFAKAGNLSKALFTLTNPPVVLEQDPIQRLRDLHQPTASTQPLCIHQDIIQQVLKPERGRGISSRRAYYYYFAFKMVRKALKAPDHFGIRAREHMLLLLSDPDLA